LENLFNGTGGFADFLFEVPPFVFDIDPQQHTVNIIGDGDAPVSFTSYEEYDPLHAVLT
jgi:hypothetical protein